MAVSPQHSRGNDADKDLAALPLFRHDYHGEWNQTHAARPKRRTGWSLFLRGTCVGIIVPAKTNGPPKDVGRRPVD